MSLRSILTMGYFAQLVSPFTWARIKRESTAAESLSR